MSLLQYIAGRLLNGLAVLIGVVVVIFFLFNVLPVNSARMTLGQRADATTVQAIEREFRLNLPWHQRLLLYFNDLSPLSVHDQAHPDSPSFLDPQQVTHVVLFQSASYSWVLKKPYLGKSFQSRRPVAEILSEKIYPTFVLALSAMLFASIIGIILGVFAALKQYSFWDNLILVFTVTGISQPAFFSGIILAIVFGYYLGDWTGLNVQGSLIETDLLGETITVWKNLWLPMLALGIRPIAIITQLTRSSMLEVLSMDYIRTARAKGLSFYSVTFKHALRNAMNPVVTSISGWLAALLTGAYFIEQVFNYNGLGLTTIQSLMLFDFPVVMGAVLLVAVVFIVMNIFTDILYSLLDPRVVVR